MNLEEYIDKAISELEEFKKHYLRGHDKAEYKNAWPLEMLEEEWAEQEIAYRF